MGSILAPTKIVDRATGEIFYGRVPPYSVVVSGTMPGKLLPDGKPGPNLYCAAIVKRVRTTRSKTAINELLRDWHLTPFPTIDLACRALMILSL